MDRVKDWENQIRKDSAIRLFKEKNYEEYQISKIKEKKCPLCIYVLSNALYMS